MGWMTEEERNEGNEERVNINIKRNYGTEENRGKMIKQKICKYHSDLTHVLSDSHSVQSICLCRYCDQAKWFQQHVAVLPCGHKPNQNRKTDTYSQLPHI